MKVVAIFAAVIAVALSAPASWTVNQVSDALQDPSTNPALIPFLENALNEMMDAIYAGYPAELVQVAVPAVSTWTLQQINAALDDPATNPALVPYLEHALNEIMHALVTGQQVEAIAVVVPADIAPVQPETPVVPVPEIVMGPIPGVASPEASPSPSPSTPLVQIIVNVAQSQPAPAPVVETPIAPEPVIVVEQPAVVDVPYNPIDAIHPGGVAINPIVPGPVVGPIV